MPPPRYTYNQFKKQYEAFNCTEEQKRQIFEDQQTQNEKSARVEGWSFVQRDEPLNDPLMGGPAEINLQHRDHGVARS